jgi:hypothetical protein
MTAPYRAMCAELIDALDSGIPAGRIRMSPLANRARAALAQPEPEVPTDEDLDAFIYGFFLEDDWYYNTEMERGLARAVLAKWGTLTPQPVAVSERLPGPEDCLDEGWAWFFNKRIGWRQAVLPVSPGYTHWLPANALPTPEDTNDR